MLKEEPAEKQDAQHKNESVDNDFDKAHCFTYPEYAQRRADDRNAILVLTARVCQSISRLY